LKRTNLIVDESLLAEAKRLLGAETQSEAVNLALQQTIKLLKIRGLMNYIGADVWTEDLSAMREDRPKKKRRAV
jgi:Arc/MetJ family transcription regulator